jgi:hypothetical protein
MPTFDGGHYFLSVLVPIRTDTLKETVKDVDTYTSPVHALRKRLDVLPTAAQIPHGGKKISPFAHNKRTHFARFVIIDDVAYNGRDPSNAFLSSNNILTAAQPQDHLSCPFLLLSVDFDAKDGSAAERDSYLAELWSTMREDLRKIFELCQGFAARVTDATTFAAYIADCQLETTMSFNDYYAVKPDLPAWPKVAYLGAAIASGGATLLGLVATLCLLVAEVFTPSLQTELGYAVALTLIGAVALVVVVLTAYVTVMAAGAKPFPTAPDSNLPAVLKALHLQRTFTRFAIDNQTLAAGSNAQSAQQLYDSFAAFIATSKPHDLGEPTQAPGRIGI